MKAITTKAVRIAADKFQDLGLSGIIKLFSRRRCLARVQQDYGLLRRLYTAVCIIRP